MPILRFPNPVSNIPKFVDTFRTIYKSLYDKGEFGHDDITKVMIKNGLVSSCGGIGELALSRSTRDNRTRDPLYNQSKMYSELYRMLGWFHTGKDHTHFKISELGKYIGKYNCDNLVKECVLSIVFPNPYVENKGKHSIRPFYQLLKFLKDLDGVIFRDELIICVLSMNNDRDKAIRLKKINAIKSIRGNPEKLKNNLSQVSEGIQINTVRNYTRFPLGILKSADWAEPIKNKSIYGKSLTAYQLKSGGEQILKYFDMRSDIRAQDIKKYSEKEKAHFILLAHYTMLKRTGFEVEHVEKYFNIFERGCSKILKDLKITSNDKIFFSPFQQADKEEIKTANILDSQIVE